MHPFKKTIILLVILLFSNIHFPQISLARQNSFTRIAKAKSITKQSPKYLKSPEEEIPTETIQDDRKKWLWSIVLGVLVVGGLTIVLGSGGSEPPSPSKTDIEVHWE